ncbi:MAG: hypothetical protein ACI9XO_004309, partial [Paraglaciecola sp.]
VAAKSAVFNLKTNWQQLQYQTKNMLPEDIDWQERLRRTDNWLSDAMVSIDAHQQEYTLAELDHARYELTEIRRLKGVPYYLDDLYDFQENVEAVYDVASDDMLCLLEWEEFEKLVGDLNKEWQNVQQKPFDTDLFEIDKIEKGRIELLQKMIAHQMGNVMSALACDSHFEVAERVKTVEITFMKMLCIFGHFPESETVGVDS